MLDDYGKQNERTATGLDLFLRLFERNIEVIDKRYQLVLQRLNGAVVLQRRQSPIWRDALSPASASKLDDLVRYQPTNAIEWLRAGNATLR